MLEVKTLLDTAVGLLLAIVLGLDGKVTTEDTAEGTVVDDAAAFIVDDGCWTRSVEEVALVELDDIMNCLKTSFPCCL